MSQQFADPASPVSVDWKGLLGCLLVFDVTGVKHNIQTTFGLAETVPQTTITVIDGPQAGTVFGDALVFPKVLSGALGSRVGQKVLARLGQGQVAKPGQDPPWILVPATEQEKVQAGAMLAQVAGAQMQAPAPQQAYAPPPQQQGPAPAPGYAPPPQQAPAQQYAPQPAPAPGYPPQEAYQPPPAVQPQPGQQAY